MGKEEMGQKKDKKQNTKNFFWLVNGLRF